MNKAIQELQRLYFLPDQQCRDLPLGGEGTLSAERMALSLQGQAEIALKLVSSNNRVRTLVVGFEKGGDWEHLAELYRRLQNDLGLPALAVSASGKGGFQLWLSLAEPVPQPQAEAFLIGLRRKYLDVLPPAHISLRPCMGEHHAGLAPSFHEASGRWSAFIDPNLGSMFVEEPGLEIAPNMEGQADILAGFESIKVEDFQRALHMLQACYESNIESAERPSSAPSEAPRPVMDIGTDYRDPQSFLLAVMNSSYATLDQRIMAATALLSHFESPHP